MRRRSCYASVVMLAAAAVTACTAGSDATPAQQTVSNASVAALPEWLPGVWTREWIERRGTRSNTLDVHYLQTPSLFADMRIPRDRPAFRGATSFTDLTDEQLHALAQQRGFTGRTTAAGAIATWHHEIDFQPPDPGGDIGRLERVDGSRMYEHALDSSYVESWQSVSNGDGRFLVLRIERAGRLDRTLFVAGDHFLYVRNRAKDLPVAPSVDSLIAATRATRSQIIEYLDCEFSVGRVRSGALPWEIQHSTLPWREGQHLELVDQLASGSGADVVVARGAAADGVAIAVNTFPTGELAELFRR